MWNSGVVISDSPVDDVVIPLDYTVPVYPDLINFDTRSCEESSDDEDEEEYHWSRDPSLEEVLKDQEDECGIFKHGVPIRKEFLPQWSLDPKLPLYPGSTHSTQDLCRYFLAMKHSLGLGEVDFSIIIGSVISFLPPNNGLCSVITSSPTRYKLMQAVHVFAAFRNTMRTLKFHTCLKGCATFLTGQHFCDHCHECRWRHCSMACFEEDDEGELIANCYHHQKPTTTLYYLPLRDRMMALLKSDLKNFFNYDTYRHKPHEVIRLIHIYQPCTYHVLTMYITCT